MKIPRPFLTFFSFPVLTVCLIALFLIGVKYEYEAYASYSSRGDSTQARVEFPDQMVVTVEVANSDEERRIGLSEHIFLDGDRGMLFLFDRPDRYKFWMKEMKFPIDIVWMHDGKIVDIMENVPVASQGLLPTYQPHTAANQVLELNAGFIRQHPLVIGETLSIYEF